jgi:hypothetical protein
LSLIQVIYHHDFFFRLKLFTKFILEPSTSAAATSSAPSPYASAPIVDSSTPIKSSLAKPKEIPPDYEEGSKAFPPDSSKPKSTGVKIAPDVEYIPEGDVDVEEGEHL